MQPNSYAPQRRSEGLPTRLLVLASAGAVMLLAAVLLVALVAPRLDPLDREARRRAAIEEMDRAAQLEPLDLALAAAWRVLPLVLVASGAAVCLGIAWRQYGSREAVRARLVIAHQRAMHGPVPHSLTYSPHWSNRSSGELLPDLGAVAPALAAPVPAFRELLDQGRVAAGRPLILGADTTTGELVEGSFKSLYSTGLGGLQGSGKTWTAAYLLAQTALSGGRLVVVDPQLGDDETLSTRVAPLRPAFLCDVASDPREILDALRLADDELQARERGAPQRYPIVVAIDEWLSLRRGELGDVLPVLVERFSTVGRKYNVNAMLLSQRWDKAAAGEGRNTLTSAYIHRLRPEEARMLTGLRASALPDDTLQLPPGTAYLLSTSGDLRRVAIPRMTIADVAEVGRMLRGGTHPAEGGSPRPFGFHPSGSQAPAEATGKPTGNLREIKTEVVSTAAGSETLSAEDARIVALFLQGLGIPEITREISGASAGRAYQQAREHVEAVLRRALGGA
jgi:hypothetical protein